MKITESTLALQAQASRMSRLQVNESLEVWRGTRSTGAEPSLSTAGRQALQAEESAAPEAASGGAPLDAKLALVKAIVERLLGHSITLLSSGDIAATAVAEGSPAPGANAPAARAACTKAAWPDRPSAASRGIVVSPACPASACCNCA